MPLFSPAARCVTIANDSDPHGEVRLSSPWRFGGLEVWSGCPGATNHRDPSVTNNLARRMSRPESPHTGDSPHPPQGVRRLDIKSDPGFYAVIYPDTCNSGDLALLRVPRADHRGG